MVPMKLTHFLAAVWWAFYLVLCSMLYAVFDFVLVGVIFIFLMCFSMFPPKDPGLVVVDARKA